VVCADGDISYDGLPADVRERTKWLVTDLIGIALRARHEAESTPSLLAAAEGLGMAHGQASVIGENRGYTPAGAALINGTLAHSLDFDDTHAAGSIHPSAPIVPAALVAAEMAGTNGREVIASIVAGYEVQIRLSLALIPKEHYDRGFHPSATCGVFGAAAAAGRVFGLSADQIADAFGIALSQAAGSMQFLVDGAWTKRLQVGYAAMSGLIAASLAREGFKGAVEAIEGRAGFLRAYAPNPVLEKAVEGLGQVYETMAIAVKPYPSCRYSHAAIDALIALRAEHDIGAQEIESVEIGLGQFSMPFVAAVALREGRMRWDDYARHINDADTLGLCKRIHSIVDPKAEAEFPAQLSAVARVRTKRGSFEKFVVIPKGEPENFISQDELRAKFDGLVGPYLSDSGRDKLLNALFALEKAGDIGALLQLARPDQAVPQRAAAGAE
jgi:2-methylcitrate dehydratase PrpD